MSEWIPKVAPGVTRSPNAPGAPPRTDAARAAPVGVPLAPLNPPASPVAQLVKPLAVQPSPVFAPSREAQQLWFATERLTWSSLAVVPVGKGITALGVARQLSDVSAVHHFERLAIIDATTVDLKDVSATLAAVAVETRDGGRVVVAMSSLEEVLAGLPIARSVSAVLLCVELGRSDIDAARRTIAMLGSKRIVGCVAVEAEGLP